jgi:hypothetical protein
VSMQLIAVKYHVLNPSIYSIKILGDDTPLHLAVSHDHIDIVEQVNYSFILYYFFLIINF